MDEVVERYNKWHEGWLDLMWSIGRKELGYFEEDAMGYTTQIVSLKCRRNIMLWVYQHLVRYRGLTAIEKLDPEVKNKMWETIKDICAGKTENKKLMIEVCKVFYVIEYFINEQI